MPRYGFWLMRFRGSPLLVHGLRQGTTPCWSRVTIFSVTIPYTSMVVISELVDVRVKRRHELVQKRVSSDASAGGARVPLARLPSKRSRTPARQD
jgi:hypothetical protein